VRDACSTAGVKLSRYKLCSALPAAQTLAEKLHVSLALPAMLLVKHPLEHGRSTTFPLFLFLLNITTNQPTNQQQKQQQTSLIIMNQTIESTLASATPQCIGKIIHVV